MPSPIKEVHYRSSPNILPRCEGPRRVVARQLKLRTKESETAGPANALPAKPSLVSSAFDTFDRLLFTLPEDAFSHRAYGRGFKDLFRKLPDHVRYIFVVKEKNQRTLKTWIKKFRLRTDAIVTADEKLKFTLWAEDAYAAVQSNGDGRSHLVEPRFFRRSSDHHIANLVSAQCDIGLFYAKNLVFQGGNILAGDRFWLIGQDYVNQSRRYTANPVREFKRALESRRELITIGSKMHIPLWREDPIRIGREHWTEERFRGNYRGTRQPIFHIDMFITLAGRDGHGRPIVLVGDPRLAAELSNQKLHEDALPHVFDDIAEQLDRRPERFVVIRNPLPLICARNSKDRTLLWYYASSNNALVQIEGRKKEVWLPTYGHGRWDELKATDNYNVKIWRSLGFRVHRLGDFHPFAVQLGAVHCIKKYLNR